MTDSMHDQIARLIVEVADTVVLPRFRNLAREDITEKAPDDLVTIADRESEARLTDGLARIAPGIRIVGEEAAAADPALLDGLGSGEVWLVDPIDGTHNFAHGKGPFGIMLARVENGVPVAGWLYDPLARRMCHAVAGGGAYVDGRRVMTQATGTSPPTLAVPRYFLSSDDLDQLSHAASGAFRLVDSRRCAADQYPRVALGENDAAIFRKTFPWDHAAGTLFVTEAGGKVAWRDGQYRVGESRPWLIAAATPALWDMAVATLATDFGGTAG